MKHWSTEHISQIETAIEQAKSSNPHPFAVFDADNTVWKHDLVESLLGWMAANGSLSLKSTKPEILPYPVQDGETLMSYYDHLCEIDHSVAYLFASQIFAGFTLQKLKEEIDDMMGYTGSIQAPMPDGKYKELSVPVLFPGQIELMHFLQQHGVEVWIVSASLEELVRMVASNPIYGLALPPERVIGVNLMLNKPDGSVTVSAIERKSGHMGRQYYFSPERLTWTMGTVPFAPLTWYGGKVAAILEWIDDAQRPILVAGDSPNDFYMQFHVAADEGGIRLRIHRSEEHRQALTDRQQHQQSGNLNPMPTDGWIEVTAEDLGV
jgi:phosphorylcholine phosphatase